MAQVLSFWLNTCNALGSILASVSEIYSALVQRKRGQKMWKIHSLSREKAE
jgi:hypothetical protein